MKSNRTFPGAPAHFCQQLNQNFVGDVSQPCRVQYLLNDLIWICVLVLADCTLVCHGYQSSFMVAWDKSSGRALRTFGLAELRCGKFSLTERNLVMDSLARKRARLKYRLLTSLLSFKICYKVRYDRLFYEAGGRPFLIIVLMKCIESCWLPGLQTLTRDRKLRHWCEISTKHYHRVFGFDCFFLSKN